MRETRSGFKKYFCIILVVIAMSVTTCASKKVDERRGEKKMVAKAIDEVLKEHSRDLMSIPGVVGTAQGLCNDKPCIKVYVVKETPELDQKIPHILEGYPVSIEVTGEFKALPQK